MGKKKKVEATELREVLSNHFITKKQHAKLKRKAKEFFPSRDGKRGNMGAFIRDAIENYEPDLPSLGF